MSVICRWEGEAVEDFVFGKIFFQIDYLTVEQDSNQVIEQNEMIKVKLMTKNFAFMKVVLSYLQYKITLEYFFIIVSLSLLEETSCTRTHFLSDICSVVRAKFNDSLTGFGQLRHFDLNIVDRLLANIRVFQQICTSFSILNFYFQEQFLKSLLLEQNLTESLGTS